MWGQMWGPSAPTGVRCGKYGAGCGGGARHLHHRGRQAPNLSSGSWLAARIFSGFASVSARSPGCRRSARRARRLPTQQGHGQRACGGRSEERSGVRCVALRAAQSSRPVSSKSEAETIATSFSERRPSRRMNGSTAMMAASSRAPMPPEEEQHRRGRWSQREASRARPALIWRDVPVPTPSTHLRLNASRSRQCSHRTQRPRSAFVAAKDHLRPS